MQAIDYYTMIQVWLKILMSICGKWKVHEIKGNVLIDTNVLSWKNNTFLKWMI